MREQHGGYYESRQPDIWEIKNAYVGHVKSKFLKRKWGRKDGMPYDIEQQAKGDNVPNNC